MKISVPRLNFYGLVLESTREGGDSHNDDFKVMSAKHLVPSGLPWAMAWLVLLSLSGCGQKDNVFEDRNGLHPGMQSMEPPRGGKVEALPIGKTEDGQDGKPPVLKLFVVSDEPVQGGQRIDTPLFPKLGFIPGKPDLAVKELKEVLFQEDAPTARDGKTNWHFKISLTPDDGARVSALTGSNVSKRLLIMVGDVPVMAPLIVIPVESGSFQLLCNERSRMECLKSNLTRMAQAAQ